VLRQWRGAALLAKKKFNPEDPPVFSFIPGDRVRITHCFRVLRDHYEETKYDTSRGYREGSPNNTDLQTICNRATRYSFVSRLLKETPKGKKIPKEIGFTVWLAFGRPDSNGYSPWYFSITAPPEGYADVNSNSQLPARFDPQYAYWLFSKLSGLVDMQYRDRIKVTRKKWRNFEAFAMKQLKKREKEFNYFLKKNKFVAIKLMTNYVQYLEYRKWYQAIELIEQFEK
jgi:dipeptidase